MESKVCSRSQGQPPGPRRRDMMATARSKRSPVADMDGFTLNQWGIDGNRGGQLATGRWQLALNLLSATNYQVRLLNLASNVPVQKQCSSLGPLTRGKAKRE